MRLGVSSLRKNVIGQFTEEMSIFCELQCAVHRFCVAYNYKEKVDEKSFNCQLTNTTEHKLNEHGVIKEEQVWTFYKSNVDRSNFVSMLCRGFRWVSGDSKLTIRKKKWSRSEKTESKSRQHNNFCKEKTIPYFELFFNKSQ